MPETAQGPPLTGAAPFGCVGAFRRPGTPGPRKPARRGTTPPYRERGGSTDRSWQGTGPRAACRPPLRPNGNGRFIISARNCCNRRAFAHSRPRAAKKHRAAPKGAAGRCSSSAVHSSCSRSSRATSPRLRRVVHGGLFDQPVGVGFGHARRSIKKHLARSTSRSWAILSSRRAFSARSTASRL